MPSVKTLLDQAFARALTKQDSGQLSHSKSLPQGSGNPFADPADSEHLAGSSNPFTDGPEAQMLGSSEHVSALSPALVATNSSQKHLLAAPATSGQDSRSRVSEGSAASSLGPVLGEFIEPPRGAIVRSPNNFLLPASCGEPGPFKGAQQALTSPRIAAPKAAWSFAYSPAQISKNLYAKGDGSFVSEDGHRVSLGPVFSSGSYGAVSMLKVSSSGGSTLYVGKQIPLSPSHSAGSAGPGEVIIGGKKVYCSAERMVYAEVAAMLKARTALAPYMMFRNIIDSNSYEADRIFLALPVMLGTVLDALYAVAQDQSLRLALASRVVRMGSAELTLFHGNDVAMRDIKPENMLIDSKGTVHLADFGLASRVKDVKGFCTTESYAPPEVFALRGGAMAGVKSRYNAASVDIWSLGTTVTEIMLGANPFWRNFWRSENRGKHEQSSAFAFEGVQELRQGWAGNHKPVLLWLKTGQQGPMPPAVNPAVGEVQRILFATDSNYAGLAMRMLHPQPELRPTAQQVTLDHQAFYFTESQQDDNRLVASIRQMHTRASIALNNAKNQS